MRGLFDVAGKNVLVTGGSRGIGLMIARGFVEAGATVIISSRKADVCKEAETELSRFGTCIAHAADLATDEGIDSLADGTAQIAPSLDVLVNNAGATWGAPIGEFPGGGFDKVMGVNVKAVFLLTQKLLPQLRVAASAEDPARVINIGSIDGLRVSSADNFSYAASKAAVHMLTRQTAAALAAEHITVNAIAPGLFPTKMMAHALDDDAARRRMTDKVPLHRTGTPEDIAGTALFLSSRAGAYLTGAVIPVDGGVSVAK